MTTPPLYLSLPVKYDLLGHALSTQSHHSLCRRFCSSLKFSTSNQRVTILNHRRTRIQYTHIHTCTKRHHARSKIYHIIYTLNYYSLNIDYCLCRQTVVLVIEFEGEHFAHFQLTTHQYNPKMSKKLNTIDSPGK